MPNISDIGAQIVSVLGYGIVTSIVVAAGLALIGLAFLSFVLRQAMDAANGFRRRDDDEDDDDDYDRR